MMVRKIILTTTLVLSSVSSFAGNPSSVADVVGRDIDQAYAGHIGMWTGSKVLEVLSNRGTIFENTLYSFQNQPTKDRKGLKAYWGAKAANITAYKKQQVINFGRSQKAYNPQYTTSFSYTEGGIGQYCIAYGRYGTCAKYKTYPINATFRCDTFVQWSYLKGAGFKPSGLLPRNVYNSFPITR